MDCIKLLNQKYEKEFAEIALDSSFFDKIVRTKQENIFETISNFLLVQKFQIYPSHLFYFLKLFHIYKDYDKCALPVFKLIDQYYPDFEWNYLDEKKNTLLLSAVTNTLADKKKMRNFIVWLIKIAKIDQQVSNCKKKKKKLKQIVFYLFFFFIFFFFFFFKNENKDNFQSVRSLDPKPFLISDWKTLEFV